MANKTKKAVGSGAVAKNAVAGNSTVGKLPTVAPTGTGSSNAGTGAGSSASTSANRKVAGFRLKLQAMLSGVETMLPSDSSLPTVGAVPLKVADITQELETVLNAYAAVDQLLTALKQTRLGLVTQVATVRTLYAEVKQALTTFYGPSDPVLAHFGLPVKTARKKLDSTQQLASVVRAKNTRTIRHTLGSRQKAKLKFQGPVEVSTTTATAGATTAPPATPPGTGTPSSGQ